MEFSLSEEHQMTRKMVREFAESEIAPVALVHDEEQKFPMEIVEKMAELGLMGMTVPPEYGGAGTDSISYVIAVEELSRVDASVGVIAAVNNGLACEPLMRWGTEEQKERYLKPVARGEKIGCYALTEPEAGSDAAAIRTTAVLDGDEWVLNGQKVFVTNALNAWIVISYAITDPGKGHRGISAFIIPTDAPGFVRVKKENKLGIRASDTMALSFDDCRIPKENMLGERGQGFKIALATLDVGRIGIAAQAVGIAQGALDESIKYAKERHAFGQPIAGFQAIQWKLADIATELEAARLLTYRAAYMKDKGVKHTKESSMAKLFASEVAMKATREAIQIHGGYGYVKEYPVERFYRDAKITEIYEGTSEIQRLVISRAILK